MNIQLNNRAVNRLLSGLLVSMLGLSGAAFAQESEMEPNDDTAGAQLLSVSGGSAMATGMIGSAGGMTSDLDFYAFDAEAGSTVTITAATTDACANLYPTVTLYFENGNSITGHTPFGPFDSPPAGLSRCDALISAQYLQYAGRYYVVVTPDPILMVGNDFAIAGPAEAPGGGYTLSVDGIVSPAPVVQSDPDPVVVDPDPVVADPDPVEYDYGPTPIAMEVLHWRGRDRQVSKRWKRYVKRMKNRKGVYPVPVVMFSTEHFTATDIDPETLKFGVSGEEQSLFRCSRRGFDVNRDGMKDKICFFDAFKTGFNTDDLTGVLNGETKDGEAFTSSATLKVFKLSHDKKRKKWNKRKYRRDYKRQKRHNRHSRWHRRHHDD